MENKTTAPQPISEQIASLTEAETKYCLEVIYAAGKLTTGQMQKTLCLAKSMAVNEL